MKSGLWFRLLPTSNARRPTKFVLFHAGITGCRSLPLLLNCVTTRLRRAAKSLLLLCILVVRVRWALHNFNGFLVLLHLICIKLVFLEIWQHLLLMARGGLAKVFHGITVAESCSLWTLVGSSGACSAFVDHSVVAGSRLAAHKHVRVLHRLSPTNTQSRVLSINITSLLFYHLLIGWVTLLQSLGIA